MGAANVIRWRIFKAICHIGWRICPEPQRSDLYGSMTYDFRIWRGEDR